MFHAAKRCSKTTIVSLKIKFPESPIGTCQTQTKKKDGPLCKNHVCVCMMHTKKKEISSAIVRGLSKADEAVWKADEEIMQGPLVDAAEKHKRDLHRYTFRLVYDKVDRVYSSLFKRVYGVAWGLSGPKKERAKRQGASASAASAAKDTWDEDEWFGQFWGSQ